MKRIAFVSIALAMFIATTSTQSLAGTLTNARAQHVLSSFLRPGQVKVNGVREIPQQNAAMVDLTITNFVYNLPKNDAITAYAMGPGGGQRTYSGKATATFIHYTDGRWVLNRIDAPFGSYPDLNMNVP